MKLVNIIKESNSPFEIKPKEDARCPDGKCQMYDVYLGGRGVYEFANTSFKGMELEELIEQLSDTFSRGTYRMSRDNCTKMATEISKYLSR